MPYIASTPDSAILFDGRKVPVETKHSNGATTMEKQVELYMPQIQHHLLCTKADRLLFSVIFGNTEPERVWVGPSPDWHNAMLDAYARFWHHMETDTRPEGGAFSDVIMPSADSVPVNATVKRDASTDNQFMALAHDFIANEGAAKVYEAAKKDLKALMKKDEREVYSPILTMKRNRAGSIGFTVNVAAPIAAAAE